MVSKLIGYFWCFKNELILSIPLNWEPTQVRAIADNVQEIVRKETGEMAYKFEGYQALQWILIDYVNVVVHVMQPETRNFYQLEEMWHDAPSTEHEG